MSKTEHSPGAMRAAEKIESIMILPVSLSMGTYMNKQIHHVESRSQFREFLADIIDQETATERDRLKEINEGSLLALKSAYVFMKSIKRQSTHNEYLLWGDDSRKALDRVNAAITKAQEIK